MNYLTLYFTILITSIYSMVDNLATPKYIASIFYNHTFHAGGVYYGTNTVITLASVMYEPRSMYSVLIKPRLFIEKLAPISFQLGLSSINIHPNYLRGQSKYNLAVLKIPNQSPASPLRLDRWNISNNFRLRSHLIGWSSYPNSFKYRPKVRSILVRTRAAGDCLGYPTIQSPMEQCLDQVPPKMENYYSYFMTIGTPVINQDPVRVGEYQPVVLGLLSATPLSDDGSPYSPRLIRISPLADWIDSVSDIESSNVELQKKSFFRKNRN